ncbi:hypothetical protein [Stappia sp. 28M-7]|uniref:hypothetical protein n=1 Tax=Stappia sp. 28M-7 TaxID=2762596 RepID=UPI00163CB82C|nr:hypothetical protein [Stappia sp. 28M-7]MBC2858630.1 hypothetical protein [Stappia sp. 28M-7]
MADSLALSSPVSGAPATAAPVLQCVISGAFGQRVLEALRAAGVTIAGTVDLDGPSADLESLAAADTLAILDFDRPDVMGSLWDRLSVSGSRLHLIGLFEDALTVGPQFRAGRPGCPECFARRRLAISSYDDAGRLDKLSRTCLARMPSARPGYPPYLPALAAGALAARLRRPAEENDGRFLRFLTDGSFLEEGRLLALHGCRCRTAGADAAGNAGARRTSRHLADMLGLAAMPVAVPTGTRGSGSC